MGLFWDLIQQSQISDQRSRTASVEERVSWLESELTRTQETMRLLLQRLKRTSGRILNATVRSVVRSRDMVRHRRGKSTKAEAR